MTQENLGTIYVKIKADVESLEKEVKGLKGKLDKDAKKMGSSFSGMFKKGLQLAGGLLGLQAAVNFGRKIINTASQFEQLRTRLVSLYGDTDKAGQVFKKFKKIAATTPFSVKGVVSAGITLKAFGMDAEKTLKSVTDLAAYMGTNVTEAAAAVGRAFAGGAGAADVLRERGVLNLVKSFKGIKDLTKLTLPEFRKALIESLQDPAAGIAGSTTRLAKTFGGALSNMGDAVDALAASLGGGLLSPLKSMVLGFTNLLRAMTPTTDAFDEANKKADEMRGTFEQLSGTYLILKRRTKLTETEHSLLKETIRKLQQEYPNYLKNIDLEKTSYNKASTAISNARIELEKYINVMLKKAALESNDKATKSLGQRLGELVSQEVEAELKLKELQGKQSKLVIAPFDMKSRGFTEKELYQNQLGASKRGIDDVTKQIATLKEKRIELQKKLDEILNLGNITPPKTKGGGGDKGGISNIVKQFDIATDKIKTFGLEMQKLSLPSQLSGVVQGKIDFQNQGAQDLQNVFDQMTGSGESAYNWADAVTSAADIAQGAMDGFFEDIYIKADHANSLLEKAFVGMANAFIAQVKRMITQWVAFQAIRGLFSLIPGGNALFASLSAPGVADGGTMYGTESGIKKSANGSSFMVPGGFPNDSYPMLVQSGERVDVTPAGRVNQLEKTMNGIHQQIGVLNANMVNMMLNGRSDNLNIGLSGELRGEDIYVSGQHAGRVYNGYR